VTKKNSNHSYEDRNIAHHDVFGKTSRKGGARVKLLEKIGSNGGFVFLGGGRSHLAGGSKKKELHLSREVKPGSLGSTRKPCGT